VRQGHKLIGAGGGMAGLRSGVLAGVRPGQLWWQVEAVAAGILRAARVRPGGTAVAAVARAARCC